MAKTIVIGHGRSKEIGNPIFVPSQNHNLITCISGKYSKEYFRKTGELRHITKVNIDIEIFPDMKSFLFLNISAEAMAPL